MNKVLRKLLGVAGSGLSWAPLWAAVFATIALIVGAVSPEDIDPGEGPVRVGGIGVVVGFVSGAVFGIILSLAEDRRSILDLALIRVALWGLLGSATWPLLTPVDNGMLLILCPLGALCAATSVAIARRARLGGPGRPQLPRWLGRIVADPLEAACTSNG